MKHLFLSLLFLFVLNASFGQGISVDLILNTKEKNTEFQLATLVQQVLDEKTEGCISFNVISNREQGNSPYVIEMWESDESLRQYTFNKTRTRNVDGKDGKTVKQSYKASGINVSAIYKILGRMTLGNT